MLGRTIDTHARQQIRNAYTNVCGCRTNNLSFGGKNEEDGGGEVDDDKEEEEEEEYEHSSISIPSNKFMMWGRVCVAQKPLVVIDAIVWDAQSDGGNDIGIGGWTSKRQIGTQKHIDGK